jgi:hypothetical protein
MSADLPLPYLDTDGSKPSLDLGVLNVWVSQRGFDVGEVFAGLLECCRD